MATTTAEIVIEGIPEFEAWPRPTSWMARGHHDPVTFAHTLTDDPEYQRWNGHASVCASCVYHRYWRAVPVGPDMPGRVTYQETQPGRGAFPVTVYYV